MPDRDLIHILLPTYNGARFLPAQLASVQRQTHGAWRLLVRDDGSQDASVAIVDALAREDPRIERLVDGDGHRGCAGCVARLMAGADARGATLVAFADQDDVWVPGKLAQSLDRLRSVERERGETHPVLVHTDLAVVDEALQPRHPSFLRFERIRHDAQRPLETLLVQNFVTGCTALFNRPLLELALPVPDDIPMHDWWVALCAAASGTIAFDPRPTVRYRQHGAAALGTKGFVTRLLPWKANWAALWRRGSVAHRRAVAQARALRARLARLDAGAPALAPLDRWLALFEADVTGFERVRRARALGVRTQHPLRTALLYARLLRGVHAQEEPESCEAREL